MYRHNNIAALVVGGITLLLALAFSGVVLSRHDEGIMGFVQVGTRYSEGISKAEGGTTGYDGQFVYFIARDGAQAVPYIDGPSYRYQRILYPVLARALSLGQPDLVPWMMLAINVVALGAGASMLAYLIGYLGASPWFALIYALWAGNLLALRLDLTELLCYALALSGIIAYVNSRYRAAVLLLVLSMLAKEIGIAVSVGLALHAAFARRRYGWSLLLAGAPLVAYAVWWQILHLWLGDSPSDYTAADLADYPFAGLISTVNNPDTMPPTARLVNFALLLIFMGLPTLVLSLGTLKAILRRLGALLKPEAASPAEREKLLTPALTLTAASFVMMMPNVSWQDPAAAYRVGIPIFVAGMLFATQHYPSKVKWLVVWWLPTAFIVLMIPGLWTG